jgi:manganese-dependent inorganic pyrophosphatase
MNNTIYVIGHKHPDSDSICSAITYANLLNATGKEAVACRQGPLNEETKFILKRFHQENPLLLTDARAAISDIDIDQPAFIRHDETVHHAWHVMLHTQNRSLFVEDDDRNLVGICTTSNLAQVRIHPTADLQQLMATVSLKNIARTIGGRIVVDKENFHCNGHVHIITLEGNEVAQNYKFRDDIVILSSGEEKMQIMIDMHVACIVVTCGQKASETIRENARKAGIAIIETDNETMHTARIITESYSVEQVMTTEMITFQQDEYVEDVAAKMNKSRVRSYPVLDSSGRVVGAISRYHTRNYNKKKFVLVDHSSPSQTINHIENAYVTAIIDHHHIGGVTTDHPIMYRNMQVGCTCTIVNLLYEEAGIVPDADMAGLMMSAILSDTLNFKSATTTDLDRSTVKKLAAIAGISDINAYARDMLGASVALSDATPHEILNRDLKTYQIGKYKFAIGQTNYSHMEEVQKILPAFKENLQKEQDENKLDLLVMLFTDVMGEGSLFVYDGPLSYVITDLLETKFDEHSGFDSRIISRKQQLMPMISEALGNI